MSAMQSRREMTLRAGAVAIATGVALGSLIHPAPTAQSPSPATGLIVGQVLDAVSGRPSPDAAVQFRVGAGDASKNGRVIADADGRYFFAGLAAGTYTLQATKAGYSQGVYGARRPPAMNVAFPDGIGLQLSEGQRVPDATILLWKHGSISGVVTDELGEPMAGIRVRAFQRTVVSGRPRFIGAGRSTATTDDRGVYRASGLPPGQYIVAVVASSATFPADALEAAGSSRSEMFGVSAELDRLGSPRNRQFGDHALQTLSGLPIPIAASETGRLSVYQTTYFPGVSAPGDAGVITLPAGEERNGISLQLRPVPSARVSGRLVGPAGPLGLRALHLISVTSDLVPSSFPLPATALSDTNGDFTFLGVPPGQYALRVLTPNAPTGTTTAGMTRMLWTAHPVAIGDADVTGLVVNARPTVPVTGRYVLVSAPGTPSVPREDVPTFNLRVLFVPPSGEWPGESVRADARGVFEFALPGGRHFVEAEAPRGWFIKSIAVNKRPLEEPVIDVGSEPLDIVITCTTEVARLSVAVRDAQDAPAGSVRAFLFPVDRSAWSGYAPATSRLKTSRGSLSGAFIFMNMPPGAYFVVAARDEVTADWPDPEFLEILSRFATRVTIADGQQQSLDLRVSTIR